MPLLDWEFFFFHFIAAEVIGKTAAPSHNLVPAYFIYKSCFVIPNYVLKLQVNGEQYPQVSFAP